MLPYQKAPRPVRTLEPFSVAAISRHALPCARMLRIISRTEGAGRFVRFYGALMDQGYSLDVARYFFSWREKQIREHLVRSIRSETVRGEWDELASVKNIQDFWSQIESAKNRLLFRFIEPQQVRRVMGLNTNNIDLKDVIENGKILLVNLQPKENRFDERKCPPHRDPAPQRTLGDCSDAAAGTRRAAALTVLPHH